MIFEEKNHLFENKNTKKKTALKKIIRIIFGAVLDKRKNYFKLLFR